MKKQDGTPFLSESALVKMIGSGLQKVNDFETTKYYFNIFGDKYISQLSKETMVSIFDSVYFEAL